MSQELKVSVVGAGRAGRELTIPALRLLTAEATFCAICDVDLTRAQALAQQDSGVKAYSDLEQMLGEQKPDILIINTPVAHHFEAAMTAIDHGVHVLIEKPAM
ncbi:MAG: Gfo/Idh/MocA family oxidoreductase [Anaerolineae bacterium]